MFVYLIAFILVISAFLSGGKSDISDILILLTLIVLMGWETLKEKKHDVSVLEIFFLISGSLGSLCFVFSSDSILTSLQSIRTWTLITFFAITCSRIIRRQNRIGLLVNILILSSAVIAIMSLLVNLLNVHYISSDISIIFPSYGHIRYAEFFLPLFPISVLIAVNKNKHIALRVLALTAILFMFITFSRSAWISIMIIPLLLPIFFKGIDRGVIKAFSVLSFLILILFLVMFNTWNNIQYLKPNTFRFADIVYKPLYLDTRLKYYEFSIKKIIDKPLFGHGPGTFYYSSKNFFTDPSTTISAHNHMLQKMYESGILGSLWYFFVLLGLFIKAFGQTKKDIVGRAILLGIFISFIQASMDFGWEIPIVYLINMIFLFYYQSVSVKNNKAISKMNMAVFILIIVSSIFFFISPKSTSEKFSKILSTSPTQDYVDSNILKEWISLDRGNGRLYAFMAGKEYLAKHYQSSLDFALMSVSSPMYSVSNPIYLVRYLMLPGASKLADVSVYKLMLAINNASYPHDFFWIKPDHARLEIWSVVHAMADDAVLQSKLSKQDVAKIFYWKFLQVFNSQSTKFSDHLKYIDRAVELDGNNQEYKTISKMSHDIMGSRDDWSMIEEIEALLNRYPKRDVYINLGDLIYRNISSKLEKSGDLLKELEVRRLRVEFSGFGDAYITLALRLRTLNRQQESGDVIRSCIKIYPDCGEWYKNSSL